MVYPGIQALGLPVKTAVSGILFACPPKIFLGTLVGVVTRASKCRADPRRQPATVDGTKFAVLAVLVGPTNFRPRSKTAK